MRVKYTKVLFHYLQTKYGKTDGIRKFSETLMMESIALNQTLLHYNYSAYRRYVLSNSCPSLMFRECLNDI